MKKEIEKRRVKEREKVELGMNGQWREIEWKGKIEKEKERKKKREIKKKDSKGHK